MDSVDLPELRDLIGASETLMLAEMILAVRMLAAAEQSLPELQIVLADLSEAHLNANVPTIVVQYGRIRTQRPVTFSELLRDQT